MVKAERSADFGRFRQALADYLSNLYGLPPGPAMQRFRQVPEAGKLLRDLERASYAAASSVTPDLTTLTNLAQAEAKRLASRQTAVELPALYS